MSYKLITAAIVNFNQLKTIIDESIKRLIQCSRSRNLIENVITFKFKRFKLYTSYQSTFTMLSQSWHKVRRQGSYSSQKIE